MKVHSPIPSIANAAGIAVPVARVDYRARGFSLVELMVALAIASLLLGALTVMFVNTSNARGDLDRSSRQIESGRYAMQVLADEVRHAGYYGVLANEPAAPVSLPDPCAYDVASVVGGIGIPLQGYAPATTAPVSCLTGTAAGYKPNTAVLVVRRADTSPSDVVDLSVSPLPALKHNFYIQTSGCPGDSSRYALDSYTNANTTTFSLHSNLAPGCIPITGAKFATISPFFVRIYYISTCSGTDCSSASDNVPTLKRLDITPDITTSNPAIPTSIVDGIESLQMDYGIDTSAPGDGSPDLYTNTTTHTATTPSNITEWQNVMALRLYVLARNLDSSSGFTDTKTYALGPVTITPTTGDAFRRHAYNELVRLNNPAGRRE